MLILRAFPPLNNLPSPSPFVLKTMGYLKLLELDWQLDIRADIRKQPSGKFPVLVDGDTIIPDSTAIATYLEKIAGRKLNDGLTDAEKTLSHALMRMAEQHLYFFVVYNRWSVDENFAQLLPQLQKLAPFPMSKILPGIIRNVTLKQVKAQGVGRMSPELRVARLAMDLGAIEHQLGGGPWLFGDTPHAADLSVAAMLVLLQACPADTDIRAEFLGRPNLVAYAERAMPALFPSRDDLVFTPRS